MISSILGSYLIFVLPIGFVLFGCASHYYVPPRDYAKVSNILAVKESKDSLWKRLIPAIGREFFVINNLDKDSGLINISYSGDPEAFVDCGIVQSAVNNLAGSKEYRFPASRASVHYETMQGIKLYRVSRKMELEGRLNLVVEEIDASNSRLTVNGRYVIKRFRQLWDTEGRTMSDSDSISFNSGGEGVFASGDGSVICRPTGELERRLIRLVGPAK